MSESSQFDSSEQSEEEIIINSRRSNRNRGNRDYRRSINQVSIPFSQLPETLKKFVSETSWVTWSVAKKQSYQQMFANPNSFFYRNRPPGESQKIGPFSQQEEKLFVERLNYFREKLGIHDGMWGYFAVGIPGRLGYQCSSYYRMLLQEKKLADKNYKVEETGKLKCLHRNRTTIPKESAKILEEEAIAYILNCSSLNDQQIDTLKKKSKKRPLKNNEISEIEEPQHSPLRETRIPHPRKPQNDFTSADPVFEENSEEESEPDTSDIGFSPYYGAQDQITKKPMRRPTISPYGYMFDYETWLDIINNRIPTPSNVEICLEKDLVEINDENYPKYKFDIINVFS